MTTRTEILDALAAVHDAIAGQWVDDHFAILCEALASTGSDWIPIGKRLPKHYRHVWVCGHQRKVHLAVYRDNPDVKHKNWGIHEKRREVAGQPRYFASAKQPGVALKGVTHWCEMKEGPPPPPKD